MTTVDILFRYGTPPAEAVVFALGNIKEVWPGFGAFAFDREARTVRVEYDATRLNGPAVTQLVREAGLDVQEELVAHPAPSGLGARSRDLKGVNCAHHKFLLL